MLNPRNKVNEVIMKFIFQVLWKMFPIFIFANLVYGDHPNEGKVAISQLIEEAEANNLELKKSENDIEVLQYQIQGQYSSIYPHFSLEGGPQTSKFDDSFSNGTSFYGKLEWNIYNGGADQSLIDYSRRDLELQKKKAQFLKNKIKIEVSRIYYELQFIIESISLKQKALELNSQQMKIAKLKNTSGFTTSSDLLEFDLRESTLQSDLIFLNQQLTQKSRDLDVVLSRKSPSASEFVKGHLTRDTLGMNRDQLLSKMSENNELLLSTEQKKLESDFEKTKFKSQFFPKIDLEAKYGILSNEEKVFNDKNNYSLFLKFNLPLFSGFSSQTSHKILQEKGLFNDLSTQQIQLKLTADLDTYLSEWTTLNARLDIEEKNLERSE